MHFSLALEISNALTLYCFATLNLKLIFAIIVLWRLKINDICHVLFAELFCGFPGIFDAAVQTKGLPQICLFLKDKCPFFVSPEIMFCHPFTFL